MQYEISNLKKTESTFKNDPEWFEDETKRFALKLFHNAARRVPAYKDFLYKHKISPLNVKSIADFKKLPVMDKKNYIDEYEYKDLVWDSDLDKFKLITSSSGTLGFSYYWPSHQREFLQSAFFHNYIFDRMGSANKNTLVIICFGMGTWTAGMFTLLSSYLCHKDSQSFSIITPGFDKNETLRILNTLALSYEQIILVGYPTFLKDIVEDWKMKKKYRGICKFIFSGEGITELFRDYLLEMVRSKKAIHDSVSIFGSADAAFIGFETPYSISTRKKAQQNKQLRLKLFNNIRTPSLHVYMPQYRFLEQVKENIVLTAERAIPLLRYNTYDRGGILSAAMIRSNNKSRLQGFDYNTPYVYTFGRDAFTATIFAAHIYPENVKDVLLQRNLRRSLTGKYIFKTKFTKNQNHYLDLTIELKENIKPSKKLKDLIIKTFVTTVRRINSEYNEIYGQYGKKVLPNVRLVAVGDPIFLNGNRVKKTS